MVAISVIIPTFNCGQFIESAIQSALNQTVKDIEIIVVDDGSMDDTQAIVKRIPGPITYHRQVNSGAAAARNRAAGLSKGEWIAFLDADDRWYPEKLAVQIEHSVLHPEAVLIYSELDAIDSSGSVTQEFLLRTKLARRKRKGRRNLVSAAFGDRPFPYPSTVLLKNNVFSEFGGFSQEFRGNYHEDFELFARIASKYEILFIPEALTQYRQGATAYRWNYATRQRNWLLLLNHLELAWQDDREKLKVLNDEFAKYYSAQGKQHLMNNDYAQARQCFGRAFKYRPIYARNLSRWILALAPGIGHLYTRWRSKPPASPV